MDDQATPNDATAEADRQESASEHRADRAPNSEEEAAAERSRNDPELGDMERVGENYREMAQRGAEDQGEGRLD